MAKSPQPRPNPERLLEIGNRIADVINEFDLPLVSDGAVLASVKYEDGSFRKKTVGAQWNFFPAYQYVGARGDLIFGLSSPDVTVAEGERQWEFAEFTVKQMDDLFPLLLGQLTEHIPVGATTLDGFIKHLYNVETTKERMDEESAEEKLRALPTFGMF